MSEDLIVRWQRFLSDQPCLICGGIEGCDHTVVERAEAIERSVDGTPPSKPLTTH